MLIPAGTLLGPYEIGALLGAGGRGDARDTRLDRQVAIKLLLAADADRIRRFELEARAAGRLNHPNIVSIYDVGQVPDGLAAAGAPFMVTELLDGHTLRAELDGRALPVRTALAYGRQIAEGLAAAHDQGIVHRDLKPANVFVTRHGHLKILDFGLAKLRTDVESGDAATATARAEGTGAGVVLGTVGYMAPEQVRAQPVDHRADIFAFGAILYEMLAGRRAFRGETSADTMSAILNADPPSMRGEASGPQVPPAVERLVRRCLEKMPERRFQSARDLAFSFEELSEASGEGVSGMTPATSRVGRWTIGIAGALVVAAGIGFVVWNNLGPTTPVSPQDAEAPTLLPFLVAEAVETAPSWSPTANLVAYASDAAGNNDVWISDMSGAGAINLTKDSLSDDTFPVWTSGRSGRPAVSRRGSPHCRPSRVARAPRRTGAGWRSTWTATSRG